MSRLFAVFAVLASFVFLPAVATAQASDPENTLFLDLKDGRVTIQLRPDLAPQHVERIKKLAREGVYDGSCGSNEPDLAAEFTNAPFRRGTLGMARASSPNSANSQFFIMFNDGDWLNGKYTVFGEVVDGMQFIDNITRGEPPANPDKIVKMQVAADAQ